ncbi:MAG: flagellar hook-basal body complex protein [Clostridiales bacterium]|nr:flagellar hook-basal body complex protein [Clostridiales bacterium]
MIRSMYSGVAGLKTHQTKMDVIGNNISNVNTYAFKASRVVFRDVFYQTTKNSTDATSNVGGNNASQIGYGSNVASIDVNTNRSGMVSTGLDMDCYINGEGYFVVSDASGNIRYTRLGAFSFDGEGNLVDGNNMLVQGFAVSGTEYQLPINGTIVNFGESQSAKIISGYKTNIVYVQNAADAGVLANEADKTLTISLQKDDTAIPAVEPTITAMETLLQDATKWSWEGGTAPANFVAADVAGDTTVTPAEGETIMREGSGKVGDITLFDTSAIAKIKNTYGSLISQSVDTSGIITGTTQTGEIVTLGKICLANIANPAALTLDGTSYYVDKANTGDITFNEPNDGLVGGLVTGCLESSNVDLATELSDMILTERGYQACSKMITVSDEMLQELLNMKR